MCLANRPVINIQCEQIYIASLIEKQIEIYVSQSVSLASIRIAMFKQQNGF